MNPVIIDTVGNIQSPILELLKRASWTKLPGDPTIEVIIKKDKAWQECKGKEGVYLDIKGTITAFDRQGQYPITIEHHRRYSLIWNERLLKIFKEKTIVSWLIGSVFDDMYYHERRECLRLDNQIVSDPHKYDDV